MTVKEFLQKEIVLLARRTPDCDPGEGGLLRCFFACWIVLALLELFMPGFVIYYFNLNWLLVIIFLLAFVDLLFNRNK